MDIVIPARTVRDQAIGTVLDTFIRIDAVAAAAVTEGIQGAVAEQAVEIITAFYFMAGKVFAGCILKEFVGVFHIVTSLH
jgi:hypothetical protein